MFNYKTKECEITKYAQEYVTSFGRRCVPVAVRACVRTAHVRARVCARARMCEGGKCVKGGNVCEQQTLWGSPCARARIPVGGGWVHVPVAHAARACSAPFHPPSPHPLAYHILMPRADTLPLPPFHPQPILQE